MLTNYFRSEFTLHITGELSCRYFLFAEACVANMLS